MKQVYRVYINSPKKIFPFLRMLNKFLDTLNEVVYDIRLFFGFNTSSIKSELRIIIKLYNH